MGGEARVSNVPGEHYKGVRFYVIIQFPGKKRYVTLEWPLSNFNIELNVKEVRS